MDRCETPFPFLESPLLCCRYVRTDVGLIAPNSVDELRVFLVFNFNLYGSCDNIVKSKYET